MDMVEEKCKITSLLRFINYTNLRKEKIIPKQTLFTNVPRNTFFPKIAPKMGYMEYGLFIQNITCETILCYEEELFQIYDRFRKYIPSQFRSLYRPEDYIDFGIVLRNSFEKIDNPIFGLELYSETDNIVGYPSIVTRDCIYDIKTTRKFGSMRTQILIPQLLSYYALAQIKGLSYINSVGVILPAQRIVLKVNIEDWDWKPFWRKIIDCVSLKKQHDIKNSLHVSEYKEFQEMMKRVGYHVEKSSLREMIAAGLPTQFFVNGRISTKVTSLSKELTLFLKNRFKQPVFIHSPYTINLSNPYGKFSKSVRDVGEEVIPWACQALVDILNTGEKAALNGVVVHCGKRGKLSQEVARKEMYSSLCHVARCISEDRVCPLLLETSSGQCGELLYDSEDFSEFYLSLPEDVRNKIKICVDSAHTFSANYDPMDFISVLESKNIPIALIHYNDSKVPKGSKKDRHARIGEGHIGLQSLYKLLSWSIKNNIPCVHE